MHSEMNALVCDWKVMQRCHTLYLVYKDSENGLAKRGRTVGLGWKETS